MHLTFGRVFLLLVLAVPIGLVFHVHQVDAARNAEYGEIATRLAGRAVEVHCPSFWKKLVDVRPNRGRVGIEGGRVNDYADLSMEICDALDDVRSGKSRDTLACLPDPPVPCVRRLHGLAFGIEALTHESIHLRGIIDEAQTECIAMQTSTQTSVELGIPPDQALQLNTWYVENLYPNLPPAYHSPDCRPGGPWDLQPDTPAWPIG